MSVNNISGYVGATTATNTTNTKPISEDSTKAKETASSASGFSDTAVVYEKSSNAETTNDAKVTEKTDRSAIIAQLQADAEARTQQLRDIVEKMMMQQGTAIANADSMWAFLAKGEYTVSAEVKAQAQADIAEDGYWGVEQTSERILDFAKALAGNDPDKADELLDAFKDGFSQATKTWGKELPDLSQRTYEAVEKKFDEWKQSANTNTNAANNATAEVTA